MTSGFNNINTKDVKMEMGLQENLNNAKCGEIHLDKNENCFFGFDKITEKTMSDCYMKLNMF